MLTGLSLAKALGAKSLIIQADSQLIIRQVKRDYEAKEERMQKYLKIVQQLSQHFDSLDFAQIPRAKNAIVDFLARLASSYLQCNLETMYRDKGAAKHKR